jgi:hypothetical protein
VETTIATPSVQTKKVASAGAVSTVSSSGTATSRKPVSISDAPTYSGSGTTRDPVVVELYD